MLKTFSIGLVGVIDATNVDMNSIKWTEFIELKKWNDVHVEI